MKNVLAAPLDELQPFVGEWSVEGGHVALPNEVIRGRSVFEWWGDRTFLIHRSTFDHPDIPDSISVIGATRPGGGLAQHYFDTRAVNRLYDMTFDRRVWTLARKAVSATDFDQRSNGKFSADGNTITADFERTDPGASEMKHDMAVTYTRVTRG